MSKGFFTGSEVALSKPPISNVPRCGACGLLKKCQSPKINPTGRGKRRILIIGEAPGKEEDRKGENFVGPSGQFLRAALDKLGVDMKRDCWLTNALICRPPDNKIEDDRMIDYCRPNLVQTIKELEPEVIIPLGGKAVASLIGWIWKEDPGSISRWIGWRIPEQSLNAWICPTWHPSFVMRPEFQGSKNRNEVAHMMWLHHLEQAVSLRGRPWDKIPQYESKVEVVLNPKKAARIIYEFIEQGGRAAFDYETDRLKPDSPEATIVCCSISLEGKRTIAFPWMGKVIPAMSAFLKSDRIWKIASNIKFEDRWSRAKLGHEIKNWLFCTMNGAHVIDNRHDITSIKFQSFVCLGAKSYDDHIKPFLSTKGKAIKVNRILEEIDFKQLLLYCGLDSLLEVLVAKRQMRYLNYDPRKSN